MGLEAPALHSVVQRGPSQAIEVIDVFGIWQAVNLHRHQIADPIGFCDVSAAQV